MKKYQPELPLYRDQIIPFERILENKRKKELYKSAWENCKHLYSKEDQQILGKQYE